MGSLDLRFESRGVNNLFKSPYIIYAMEMGEKYGGFTVQRPFL